MNATRYCWLTDSGWRTDWPTLTGSVKSFRWRWRSGTPMHSDWDFLTPSARTTPIRCSTANSYRIRCCWRTATGWQKDSHSG
jgi:hypothetical protein